MHAGVLCGVVSYLIFTDEEIKPMTCECSDPGCECKGECANDATTTMRRIDMEDGTTTFDFCDDCASDALDSGVFATDDEEDVDEDDNEEPLEDDGYIVNRPFRGYDVSYTGKFIGNFSERDDAERALIAAIKRDQFFPNCWFESDHGNLTLISVLDNGNYWA